MYGFNLLNGVFYVAFFAPTDQQQRQTTQIFTVTSLAAFQFVGRSVDVTTAGIDKIVAGIG
ncbi:hypothetical protein [Methylomonas koyamae]|uniref:hypothetical protein n=1 Tax=Methylomonas koyamae TaxID=702114 RepID=UPI002110B1E0|nr:hypothetical protein [Methylomonas koyamae]